MKVFKGSIEATLLILVLLFAFTPYWLIVFTVAFIYFISDYLMYRWMSKADYRAAKPIRNMITKMDIRNLEITYSLKENHSSLERRALSETSGPIERYFFWFRYLKVFGILEIVNLKGKRVLDVGCGYGKIVLHTAQNSAHSIGLDIYR